MVPVPTTRGTTRFYGANTNTRYQHQHQQHQHQHLGIYPVVLVPTTTRVPPRFYGANTRYQHHLYGTNPRAAPNIRMAPSISRYPPRVASQKNNLINLKTWLGCHLCLCCWHHKNGGGARGLLLSCWRPCFGTA